MPRSWDHKDSTIFAASKYNSKVVINSWECSRALFATELLSKDFSFYDIVWTETFLELNTLKVKGSNIFFENNPLEGGFQK